MIFQKSPLSNPTKFASFQPEKKNPALGPLAKISPSGMQIFELSHQASGAAVVISNTDGYNGSGVLSKLDVEDFKSMHEAAICRVVTNSCFGKLEKK